MDGTIYLDDQLFDGTLAFLKEVRRRGGRYLFLTNNSSKGVDAYVTKLLRLGIPAAAEDFVTSVDAMIGFLKERYGKEQALEKRMYVMGTTSFQDQLRQAGFQVVTGLKGENDAAADGCADLACRIAPEDVDVLIAGFDRELTFQKLEDACILLGKGVDYFATNPDWVCPTAWGYVPDCGSMCEMLERATGRRPYFVGKPQPDMVHMALKEFGYRAEEAVLIGDRLYTDIACGENAGIDTIFVLSGEGTMEDLATSQAHPTYVMENIKEVYRRLTEAEGLDGAEGADTAEGSDMAGVPEAPGKQERKDETE